MDTKHENQSKDHGLSRIFLCNSKKLAAGGVILSCSECSLFLFGGWMPAAKWANAWEAIEAIKRVKMHFLQILWLENVWKLENISQFHVDNHTAFSASASKWGLHWTFKHKSQKDLVEFKFFEVWHCKKSPFLYSETRKKNLTNNKFPISLNFIAVIFHKSTAALLASMSRTFL